MSDFMNCHSVEEFNRAIELRSHRVCPITGVHDPGDHAFWNKTRREREKKMANAIVDAYLELREGHTELAQEILGRVIDTTA